VENFFKKHAKFEWDKKASKIGSWGVSTVLGCSSTSVYTPLLRSALPSNIPIFEAFAEGLLKTFSFFFANKA
jgi:hypothetical protein